MALNEGATAMSGDLLTDVRRAPRAHKIHSLKTPFGRVMFSKDPGDAVTFSGQQFVSSLHATIRNAKGKVLDHLDLGSGLVTNAGVNSLANDWFWATATLKAANFHGCGTGTTAAAATDVVLQTINNAFSGGTNNYITGAQSLVAPNIYKTVATFNYTGTVSVTEWALFEQNFAPVSIPATGTTYSATGAAFTALGAAPSVQGTIVNLAAAANTPTTTPMGIVTASATTSVTIPAWFTYADAGATTPTNATAAQVIPTMWDHKVFTSIGVNNGDSITFTYQATCTSGG